MSFVKLPQLKQNLWRSTLFLNRDCFVHGRYSCSATLCKWIGSSTRTHDKTICMLLPWGGMWAVCKRWLLWHCFSPSISCVNLLPPCLLVSPALEGCAFDCYTSCGRLHFHSISAHWNLSSSVGNFRGSVHEVARWCSWFHPWQRQGKQCCLFLWTKSVLWVPPSSPPHSIAHCAVKGIKTWV